MKSLVFLASPNKSGNTAKLLEILLKEIQGEVEVVNVYDEKVNPCIDCKYCYTNEGKCSIKDNMEKIYTLIDNSDNIIIASPMYFSGFPSPMKSVIDRAQVYWSKKYIFKKKNDKKKNGILIVTSGIKWNNMLQPMETIGRHFFNTIGANLKVVIHAEDTDNVPVDKNDIIKNKIIDLARNIEDTSFYVV